MVRRKIIWTSTAEDLFFDILQFYIQRNGNATFSKKLFTEDQKVARLLAKYPYLGKRSDISGVYVLVHINLMIFYKVASGNIVILFIRDCRQRENTVNLGSH
jgi:plasmid stabilization system protein ParE